MRGSNITRNGSLRIFTFEKKSGKMILSDDHEKRLQPEETDSLGYHITPFEKGIEMSKLPAADLGFISETLYTALEAGVVKFTGVGNKYPDPIDIEVELSGKFISAYVTVDNHRTGTKFCIAIEGDDRRFRYANLFKEILENPATDKESWYRQVHNYHRV